MTTAHFACNPDICCLKVPEVFVARHDSVGLCRIISRSRERDPGSPAMHESCGNKAFFVVACLRGSESSFRTDGAPYVAAAGESRRNRRHSLAGPADFSILLALAVS